MTSTTDGDDNASKLNAIRDGIDTIRTQASDAAHSALSHAKDGVDQVREKASDAYAAARDQAKTTGGQAAEQLENNPLVALLGGIAIGAAIGALLPRTEREAQALGSVSEKLRGIANEAVGAARGAGQDKLSELGLTREKAKDTVKSLLDGALAAATSAGSAAVDSARQKRENGG